MQTETQQVVFSSTVLKEIAKVILESVVEPHVEMGQDISLLLTDLCNGLGMNEYHAKLAMGPYYKQAQDHLEARFEVKKSLWTRFLLWARFRK